MHAKYCHKWSNNMRSVIGIRNLLKRREERAVTIETLSALHIPEFTYVHEIEVQRGSEDKSTTSFGSVKNVLFGYLVDGWRRLFKTMVVGEMSCSPNTAKTAGN